MWFYSGYVLVVGSFHLTVERRKGDIRLIRHIDAGEIRPLLVATWPLGEIVAAQEVFAKKDFVGKFVLIPPEETPG